MSKVRIVIQAKVRDYEGFTSLAKQLCERVEAEEPGTLAYEWFADQMAGRATLHEIYADEEAFLEHFEGVSRRGDLEEFLELVEIEQVTVLNRIVDPRVREIAEQFNAMELHGVAGVVR